MTGTWGLKNASEAGAQSLQTSWRATIALYCEHGKARSKLTTLPFLPHHFVLSPSKGIPQQSSPISSGLSSDLEAVSTTILLQSKKHKNILYLGVQTGGRKVDEPSPHKNYLSFSNSFLNSICYTNITSLNLTISCDNDSKTWMWNAPPQDNVQQLLTKWRCCSVRPWKFQETNPAEGAALQRWAPDGYIRSTICSTCSVSWLPWCKLLCPQIPSHHDLKPLYYTPKWILPALTDFQQVSSHSNTKFWLKLQGSHLQALYDVYKINVS